MTEIPTEVQEVAARALWRQLSGGYDSRWPSASQDEKLPYYLIARAVIAAAAPFLTGTHHYLSTACYHGAERPELHAECQKNAKRWDGTPKIAGQCKYCEARCPCPCHTTEGGG